MEKCPSCGKKLYVVRMKKGDKIVEMLYCSFCFTEHGEASKEPTEVQVSLNSHFRV